ncbi:hypothetical protein N1851_028336 [Merluccius polli]|uniref:MobA-like NTP transferase domain-containing protein n=1 Tax=Merluccius polli TaxID=89951 RepID=A0AA47M8V5_MERPO|nr:hypothetical protein N1851_028336 [Merluccius polli]
MKAVILAAGYGTRLQRDVDRDETGRYRHLSGVAKPLVPVGPRVLVSHWVSALTASGCVDAVYVVTNAVYRQAFEEWASQFPNVKVLSDDTRSNEDRLGAVACLQLTVKHFQIEDHVVVIGGDTLFFEDFSLKTVGEKLSALQVKCEDNSLVLSYQCREEGKFSFHTAPCSLWAQCIICMDPQPSLLLVSNAVVRFNLRLRLCFPETHKYGILEVDQELRVLCMKEKPTAAETESRRACPCFYLLSKKCLPLLDDFLESKKDSPIEDRDAPGNFVSWLIQRRPVYTHEISGRFDVGNLPSYVECDLYFKDKLKNVETYMSVAAVGRPLAAVLHLGDAGAELHGPLGEESGGAEAEGPSRLPQEQLLPHAAGQRQVRLPPHRQGVQIVHHVLVQVPGGDAAQLHGQLLDQPLVTGGLEADPVSGVARQLLVRPDARQQDLEERGKRTRDEQQQASDPTQFHSCRRSEGRLVASGPRDDALPPRCEPHGAADAVVQHRVQRLHQVADALRRASRSSSSVTFTSTKFHLLAGFRARNSRSPALPVSRSGTSNGEGVSEAAAVAAGLFWSSPSFSFFAFFADCCCRRFSCSLNATLRRSMGWWAGTCRSASAARIMESIPPEKRTATEAWSSFGGGGDSSPTSEGKDRTRRRTASLSTAMRRSTSPVLSLDASAASRSSAATREAGGERRTPSSDLLGDRRVQRGHGRGEDQAGWVHRRHAVARDVFGGREPAACRRRRRRSRSPGINLQGHAAAAARPGDPPRLQVDPVHPRRGDLQPGARTGRTAGGPRHRRQGQRFGLGVEPPQQAPPPEEVPAEPEAAPRPLVVDERPGAPHARHRRGDFGGGVAGGQPPRHDGGVVLVRRHRDAAEHLAVPQQHVAAGVAHRLRRERAPHVEHAGGEQASAEGPGVGDGQVLGGVRPSPAQVLVKPLVV